MLLLHALDELDELSECGRWIAFEHIAYGCTRSSGEGERILRGKPLGQWDSSLAPHAAHARAADADAHRVMDDLPQLIELQVGLLDETSPHKSKGLDTGAVVLVAPFPMNCNTNRSRSYGRCHN